VRAFVGYYPMNTSSCRVTKSERYDTEEESSRLDLRKVRVVAGGLFWKPILKVMRADPQTWS
jgi:hypothetical protein